MSDPPTGGNGFWLWYEITILWYEMVNYGTKWQWYEMVMVRNDQLRRGQVGLYVKTTRTVLLFYNIVQYLYVYYIIIYLFIYLKDIYYLLVKKFYLFSDNMGTTKLRNEIQRSETKNEETKRKEVGGKTLYASQAKLVISYHNHFVP